MDFKSFNPLLILVIIISNNSYSQVKKIDESRDYLMTSRRQFSPEIIEKLKSTTTVFFLKENTRSFNDSIKAVVKSVWDLSPIIFADIDDYKKYSTDLKYSYFCIDASWELVKRGLFAEYFNSSMRVYLTLHVSTEVLKKGKLNSVGLCRIELFPDAKTLQLLIDAADWDAINKINYENAVFHNWSPVFLKAQIETLKSNLKNNRRIGLYESIKSDSLTQFLLQDTLYVSKNLLFTFKDRPVREKENEENLFKNYNYKYRICTDAELYDIFEIQKRGRLLFEYVKSSSDKIIIIYDMKNKNILYRRHSPMSRNMTAKDIEIIE